VRRVSKPIAGQYVVVLKDGAARHAGAAAAHGPSVADVAG
jgi:hypothetical protein